MHVQFITECLLFIFSFFFFYLSHSVSTFDESKIEICDAARIRNTSVYLFCVAFQCFILFFCRCVCVSIQFFFIFFWLFKKAHTHPPKKVTTAVMRWWLRARSCTQICRFKWYYDVEGKCCLNEKHIVELSLECVM